MGAVKIKKLIITIIRSESKTIILSISVANPTRLIAIFIQVNLTENWTLLSPQHWSLEKVKNVNTGRSISEG